MNHPLRTLLRELFVDPVLRMLRIKRQEHKETVTNGAGNRPPPRCGRTRPKPHDLLHAFSCIKGAQDT